MADKDKHEVITKAQQRKIDAQRKKDGNTLADIIMAHMAVMEPAVQTSIDYSDIHDITGWLRSGQDSSLVGKVAKDISSNRKAMNDLNGKERKFIKDALRTYDPATQSVEDAAKAAFERSSRFGKAAVGNAFTLNVGNFALNTARSSANFLEGIKIKNQIGPIMATTMMVSSWAVPVGMAYAAINPADIDTPPGTSLSEGATITTTFHQACTQDIIQRGTLVDAAYAVAFANSENKNTEFAYNAMMAARHHGVPAFALHAISYFESIGHSDYQADNSSATGAFQVINGQRFAYMQAYANQTHMYLEAKERIEKNQGTDAEISRARLIVQAVDHATRTSLATLNDQVEKTDLSGPALYAYNLAVDPAMQAELVALDMIKHIPGITDPNITPQKIMELLPPFYTQHHNLGIPNYNRLERLAEEFAGTPISDSPNVMGYSGTRLINIAQGNPSLLNVSMTGSQALAAIGENFQDGIQAPYRVFMAAFQSASTISDMCTIEVRNNDVIIAAPIPMPRPSWRDGPATPTNG